MTITKKAIKIMETNKIYNIDALDGLKQIEADSIDAIVSDPPYHLGMMVKDGSIKDRSDQYKRLAVGFMGRSGMCCRQWIYCGNVDEY